MGSYCTAQGIMSNLLGVEHDGRQFEKKNVCVYIYMTGHFSVKPELKERCKSSML